MDTEKVRKHKIVSRPIMGSIILIIAGYIFYQAFPIVALLIFNNTDILGYFCAIAGVLLIVFYSLWFKSEYAGCVSTNGFHSRDVMIISIAYLAIDVVMIIIALIEGASFSVPGVASFGTAFQAAFAEEAVFRVLVISTMMRYYKNQNTYMPALILSSVAFGLIHLTNAALGAGLGITIIQAIGCIFTGLLFGAIYLRTGNIVITIALHFLHDVVALFLSSASSSGIMQTEVGFAFILEQVIVMAIELVLAILLLRGHKEDIISTWNGIWKVESN